MEPEVKRHIDNARQVLVGVVPNPISQIDQITYALIYKFMDDMDQSAIAEGGEPSFFIRDLESYSWTKLMDSKIGNQNRMNLYVEAFQKFSEAEQLPELFRNILRQAFLPYRSPDVLWLFLKEIDYFDYSHPEELGNAYEYLLSIMGSQGDAGQFRTPRHIIDFIVDVIQPTENDKILDPACGTGGFLVKAYQHILEQHQGEKKLNPTQKLKIMENFEGYDIDPGMARIAQVNMFLHQFKSPKIVQYDTLSMEERWNDKFDVIMANPPFMSPKGGIKPHSKFSVQSTRSEVLFVDYIMNHLKPKGRAGIIVPEGIIFQSGNAYKQLRKNLVNDGLYAVVSLPSGVFQPYSGVKTSILMFNNEIARQRDEILFIKIENDGFDLGANKRPITKNDLPEALEILSKWRINEKDTSQKAIWVTKSKLSESGDYNLSGDRYRIATDYSNAKWPMVELGEVSEINPKKSEIAEIKKSTTVSFVPMEDIGIKEMYIKPKKEKSIEEVYKGYTYFKENDLLVAKVTPCFENGKSGIAINLKNGIGFGSSELHVIRASEKILPEYIYPFITTDIFIDQGVLQMTGTGGLQRVPSSYLQKLSIPLPPLEIQQQIVEELDSYQNIISGARQIIANWKPRIDIDPSWLKVKLRDVAEINKNLENINIEKYYQYIDISSVENETGKISFGKKILGKDLPSRARRKIEAGDVLLSKVRPNLKAFAFIDFIPEDYVVSTGFAVITSKENTLNKWIFYLLFTNFLQEQMLVRMGKGAYPSINQNDVVDLDIPLPPLEIQHKIVDRIESERPFIESAKKLIEIYTQKISTTIAKFWEK